MAEIFASAIAAVVLALGGGVLTERGWYDQARLAVRLGYICIFLAFCAVMWMFITIFWRLAQWL